jgi:hypothetical protein
MSHVVTVKVEMTDRDAIQAACDRLQLKLQDEAKHTLYGGAKVQGLRVDLPGWSYPVVIDEAGSIHYDNYGGSWGEQLELDKFVQAYTVEKATAEARQHGYMVNEEEVSDGSIRLEMTLVG